jgi:hypothetical protein
MFKNIFILSTGRCGSTTISKACEHFTNYSSGHETLSKQLGDNRFSYPTSHIESDNRLSWLLGRLDKKYGNSAFYVHLKRNSLDTVNSLLKRSNQGVTGIMLAYKKIIMSDKNTTEELTRKIAYDYIETVNENIKFFLLNKDHKMDFNLENSENDFIKFSELIGAQGDIDIAIKEFNIKYNASI